MGTDHAENIVQYLTPMETVSYRYIRKVNSVSMGHINKGKREKESSSVLLHTLTEGDVWFPVCIVLLARRLALLSAVILPEPFIKCLT